MIGVLSEQRGRTPASDTKTVRPVRFRVPAGVDVLALRFDYGPRVSTSEAENAKQLEAAFELHTARRRTFFTDEQLAEHRRALNVDGRAKNLANLLNVTLIDPRGKWRGRWDRNPSSDDGSLVLAESHASRGFLPGEIHEGEWTAAIECHGVFGDPVDWELRLEARGPLSAAEIEKLASLATATAKAKRSGPGWYFGEMHSHTVHSDGKWELEELASKVSATGCDFLCLTDHNTMSAHLAPPALPVTLIRGIELTTFYGHHPVYGISEMVPWHDNGRVRSLEEMAPEVRAQGGVVGVAHPFVPGDPMCTGCRMVPGLDPKHFDTFEVWYRRWNSPGADNEAAYAQWNEYWRQGHRVTAVGSRDVHGADQDAPFPHEMPLTGVYADDNTEEAILRALKAGRVIVSGGPIGDMSLRGKDGTTARLGETLTSGEAPTAIVDLTRTEPGVELRVLRNGEVIHRVPGAFDGTFEFSLDGHGPGWYRAELWMGDAPRLLTNHVMWDPAR